MNDGKKNEKKKDKKSIFDNRIFILLLSFILAVIVWLIVVNNVSTDITRTIQNVPVSLDEMDAAYKNYGLHVDGAETQYVNVTVQGSRTLVYALTADDIKIVPNYSAVNKQGIYTLSLTYMKTDPAKNFNILSIDPTSITVQFSVTESTRFTIEPNVAGVMVPEGRMVGTLSVNPSELTVSGPEAEVNQIARAVAYYELNEEITEQRVVTAEIILYDAAGNEVPKGGLNLSASTVDITIPVYTRGVMQLGINFINVPDGFDIGSLEYVLSATEIEVAADESIINNLTTKIVGEIDLAQFNLDAEYSFPITLRTGVLNISGIETVTVTFPNDDLDTKSVRVTEFVIDNMPANYNIEVLTTSLNNVTLIGPPDVLEGLMPSSVIGVIDAAEINIERGEYHVFLSFRIPAYSSVFAVGSYTVLISVEPS